MFTKERFFGLLAIVIGIVLLLIPLSPHLRGRLIWEGADIFFVKYSIIITFVFGGLAFVIMGILTFFGVVTTYYSEEIENKYEKAKLDVIAIMIASPILITYSFIMFSVVEKIFYKTIWALFMMITLYRLITNIHILQNEKKLEKKK